jgi:diadenosine tetraphosphatase ApaH/serine/threonine PP2A family protein phosphatase
MLIALLSDIHANREAFEACLAHAREAGARRFILLGDYVGYGADPSFVLDRVMELVADGAIALKGNHDAAVLADAAGMNAAAHEAILWTRTQLNAAQRDFLAVLPLTFEEDDRLFVHASADLPAHWTYITGREVAARSMRATKCQQTFCGHVHVPALFQLTQTGKIGEFVPVPNVEIPLLPRRQWLAVLGSVGQPRDHDPAASYALLDDEKSTLTYIRVPYDIAAAARKILTAGLPPMLATRLERGF